MRTNRKRRNERDAGGERRRAFSRRPVIRSRQRPDAVVERAESARSSTRIRALGPIAAVAAIVFMVTQAPVLASPPDSASHPGSSIWWDALVVLALILVNSLFVTAETALLTVRRTRIEQLVEEGNKSARLVSRLLAEPTRMLATIQVGQTLVQLFSAGEAANRFVTPFAASLRRTFGESWVGNNSEAIGFFTIIVLVALLTLVFGEITPKSFAIRHAERVSLVAAHPIRWLQTFAKPPVWVVTSLANLIVRPFGGTATFHTSAMSEEEIKLMVEQSEEHGVIETEEKEMIHKVFDFGDTVVRKVMTPRLDMTAIEADLGVDDLIRVVTESGHSRLPVFDDDLDNIVGIVHVKDVLAGMSTPNGHRLIRDLMRPAYFIPENKRVDDLLTELRRNRIQIAIVRDEDYGTVTGLVTVEDLLEEIVGEIQDEYDEEEEPDIVALDDHACIVDGRLELDDFNDRMGAELPTEETDTVGGFVFGLMGHQPVDGETASWDGFDFKVEKTDGKRIQKVRVCRHPAEEESQDDTGGEGGGGNGGPREPAPERGDNG